MLALREYFDRAQTAARLSELPTVQKYSIGYAAGTDPFETTVALLEEFPDVLENLPHVSVTAGSGRNRRMTIGRPTIATVQLPPRVETAIEPYALTDGWVLRYQTMPNGVDWVASSVVFQADRFPTSAPIGSALAVDVARVINEQALYAEAVVVGGRVRLMAGGPLGGGGTARAQPNAIQVLSTSTAGLLTALGWVGGEADSTDNPARPPMHRYHQATEIQVALDVITTDTNTRRELVDLCYSWATFWLERQHFALWGRGVFDEAYPDENYQVSVHQEVSWSNETAVARPGGDAKDKVHVQRVSVPITLWQYLDRSVTVASGPSAGMGWMVDADDISEDPDLPEAS